MEPNDARLTSFVDVPRGSHFPIQNLPYGMFSTDGNRVARPGTAIGEVILDLAAVARAGALELDPRERQAFDAPDLTGVFAAGRDGWRRIRERISTMLRSDTSRLRDDPELRARVLVPASQATLHVPVRATGYTDFYSSREHATNVGKLFRDPQNALLPNWLELPVAYNGRASSIVPSGTPVPRPSGQTRANGVRRPSFGPTEQLDFELEVASIVGLGNALGEPIAVDDAEAHIFGLILLNDWSARIYSGGNISRSVRSTVSHSRRRSHLGSSRSMRSNPFAFRGRAKIRSRSTISGSETGAASISRSKLRYAMPLRARATSSRGATSSTCIGASHSNSHITPCRVAIRLRRPTGVGHD